ncbi:MAG: hypothetical protein ACUVTZ_04055 [Armatimonadota bacterium]
MRRLMARAALAATALVLFSSGAYAQKFERRLAGIRIGDRGLDVLRAYGSPSQVGFVMSGGESNIPVPGVRMPVLGETTAEGTPAAPGAQPTAVPYGAPGTMPGGYPSPYGPYPPSPSGAPGNLQTSAANILNRYLGAVTGEQNPLGLSETTPGMTEDVTTPQGAYVEQLVNWVYRPAKFKNTVLEFRLDEDGYVVEICASSNRPSSVIRTSRGITFGDTYAKVLRLYGFPESHKTQGDVVTVSYRESKHVAFQFYKMKVVRIIVTAGD